MIKRAFIIHGWGGSPEHDWLQWLKEKLEQKGFEVHVPAMPNTFFPKINAWTSKLKEVVGKCDENTYFVGHSIGCQTVMRYIESLKDKEKAGGAILVAGWFNLTDDTWDESYTPKIANEWIHTKIDFEKIKKHTKKIVDFASDNDPYVPLSDAEIFRKKLNAEVIVLHGKGHVSEEDGVKEVPFVLDKLLDMMK